MNLDKAWLNIKYFPKIYSIHLDSTYKIYLNKQLSCWELTWSEFSSLWHNGQQLLNDTCLSEKLHKCRWGQYLERDKGQRATEILLHQFVVRKL